MEAIERWMDGFMTNHNPCPTSDQEFKGPLCVEQAQAVLRDPQEHIGISLLMKEEEDKQLHSHVPLNPIFHTKYPQWEEGNSLPLCFASFDLLKRILKISKKA